jgi:hypothetical protein
MPDSPERSAGIFGTKVLAAGATYDTTVDKNLPAVYEFVLVNAGGTISELTLEDDQDLDAAFVDGGSLAGQALAGNLGVNAPVTVESGNLLKKIVSGTAILHLYTVRTPNIK